MTETVNGIRVDDLRLVMEAAGLADLDAAAEISLNEALARCGEALAGVQAGSEEKDAEPPLPDGEWLEIAEESG